MSTVFAPAFGSVTTVSNSASATAAVALPKNSDEVVLTNTSTTARVHVRITAYLDEATVPTGDAPTTSSGLPILPNDQIRIYTGMGLKVIRTIATAADGSIIITPGNGR